MAGEARPGSRHFCGNHGRWQPSQRSQIVGEVWQKATRPKAATATATATLTAAVAVDVAIACCLLPLCLIVWATVGAAGHFGQGLTDGNGKCHCHSDGDCDCLASRECVALVPWL